MTITEKAAVLLGISYADNSTLLDMLAEAVADEVKVYCNIAEIPTS